MMAVVEALKPKGNTAFITILEHMDFPFISVLAQTPQLEDTAIWTVHDTGIGLTPHQDALL